MVVANNIGNIANNIGNLNRVYNGVTGMARICHIIESVDSISRDDPDMPYI